MREIKFKGKTANGEWFFGSLAYSDNIEPAIYFEVGKGAIKTFDFVYVKPETVGQFTGLLDKHGRKIFEGDIVVTCPSPLSISDGGDISKRIVVNSWLFTDMCLSAMCKKSSKLEKFYKIVGNIHDNPDLMKEITK